MLHYTIQTKKNCNLDFHSLTYLKIDFMAFVNGILNIFILIISFSTFLYYDERKLLSFYRKLKILSFLTNYFVNIFINSY